MRYLVLVALLAVVGCSDSSTAPEPAAEVPETILWSTDDYWTAFDAAEASDRPLFIFVTASYCRAGKAMEESTLKDPRVVEWVWRNTVPVRWSTDESDEVIPLQPHDFIPYVVIQYMGTEVGQCEGYLEADDFCLWLESADWAPAAP